MSGIKGMNIGNINGFKKDMTSLMKGKTKEAGLYSERCGFQVGHKVYGTTRKKLHYKNTYMRSSWEVAYAKYLDSKNIKWEYEKNTFKLKKSTYTPDFYLNEKDIYVEIKGFMHADAYFKIKEFIMVNPNIKYLLITENDLKQVGVL